MRKFHCKEHAQSVDPKNATTPLPITHLPAFQPLLRLNAKKEANERTRRLSEEKKSMRNVLRQVKLNELKCAEKKPQQTESDDDNKKLFLVSHTNVSAQTKPKL